jgi:PiT family inorganic phosphate transporter
MDPAQGFAAQSSGASVILAASHFGFPLSTTHVISGAVMGAGAAKRVSAVRWGVAGNIALAWALTLPAAALVGGGVYAVAHLMGDTTGPVVLAMAMVLALIAVFVRRAQLHAAVPVEG